MSLHAVFGFRAIPAHLDGCVGNLLATSGSRWARSAPRLLIAWERPASTLRSSPDDRRRTLGIPENEIVLRPVSRIICRVDTRESASGYSFRPRLAPDLTPAYSTLRVARSLASQRSRANEYKAQRVSGELRVTNAALCTGVGVHSSAGSEVQSDVFWYVLPR